MKSVIMSTLCAAALAAATLTTASIALSTGASAKKPEWICNARGCVRCVDTLDGTKCQVVLK